MRNEVYGGACFANDSSAEADIRVVKRGILAGGKALVASVDGDMEHSSADAAHHRRVLAWPMPHLRAKLG